MSSFSKRFAVPSGLLLVSIFFPWFTVNAVITTVSRSGMDLGPLTWLIILLALIGLAASTIQLARFRGVIELVLGVVTGILLIIAYNGFYSFLGENLKGFFGSSGDQFAHVIGGPSFGFYLATIAALSMIVFGIQTINAHKAEPLIPENWSGLFKKEHLDHAKTLVSETAATAEKLAGEVRTKAVTRLAETNVGKWLKGREKKVAFGILALVVAYGVSLAIWNTAHSPDNTIQQLISAVQNNDVGKVSTLIHTDRPVAPFAVQAFVDTYRGNEFDLKSFLAPVTSSSDFGSSSGPSLYKKNILGFVSYKVTLPTFQLTVTGPKGAKYLVDGQEASATSTVLPGTYGIVATVDSPFGSLSESITVKVDRDYTVNLPFSNKMLTVYAGDVGTAKGNLVIDGKTIPVQFTEGFFGSQSTVGPVPDLNGKQAKVEISVPWGTFVESGTVKGNSVDLSAGPNDNIETAKQIAQVIHEFNKQDVADEKTGNYEPELKFIMQNSPIEQEIRSKTGKTADETYLKMIMSPKLKLTTVQNNLAVQVRDSEFYSTQSNPNKSINWIYTMVYDVGSQSWKVYEDQNDFLAPVSPEAPNIVLTP